MGKPSPATVAELRRLTTLGLTSTQAAEQLRSSGVNDATERAVRRWKTANGIKKVWRRGVVGGAGGGTTAADDHQLDVIVAALIYDEKIGPDEGYRWVAAVVNEKLAPLRVSAERVGRSLKRVVPALVAKRIKIVEKRMQRRMYVAQFFRQSGHIDGHMKARFGSVQLPIFGYADGDCRWLLRLGMQWTKTARESFLQFAAAVATEGDLLDVSTTFDSGEEWVIIVEALHAMGVRVRFVKSVHNTRIERCADAPRRRCRTPRASLTSPAAPLLGCGETSSSR